jgi:hypothetical protein
VDHLLFRCRIAKFCYRFIREAFGWKDQPVSVENLASNWLKSKFGQSHQIILFLFTGLGYLQRSPLNRSVPVNFRILVNLDKLLENLLGPHRNLEGRRRFLDP